MKIIRYPHLKPLINSSAITIGNFDGVHLGHQALINDVVAYAKARQMQSVVVTMQPLPQQFFGGKYSIDLLSNLKLKAKLFESLGVDVMCVLNFNTNLAQMSADTFYQKVLKKGLNCDYILIGDDFRFGQNREGDYKLLASMADKDDVHVKSLDAIEKNGVRISSTQIRSYLQADKLDKAAELLGRPFGLIGRVAHGRKKGRELGFPTINLELRNGGFPLHGIYHTHINIDGKIWPSITSVGFNPTVGGNAKRVEVHVFDFKDEIYGKTVEVLFYKKLRNEVEFGSLTELTDAIAQDVKMGRAFFDL